jgi:hypothetical protein
VECREKFSHRKKQAKKQQQKKKEKKKERTRQRKKHQALVICRCKKMMVVRDGQIIINKSINTYNQQQEETV